MKPNLYYTTLQRKQNFKMGALLTGLGVTILVNLILLGAVAVAYLFWLPPGY